MTITALELVKNAYYAAGIYSRKFETVDGPDTLFGVQILNDLLAEKLIDDKMLPYYTTENFTGVIGQETYFIENLIDVDTLTFVLDSVRYPMRNTGRRDYFQPARANSVNSLPFQWHVERRLNGSNIYLYFKPQQAFTFEIWGKFGLAEIADDELLDNLELIYDRYYLTYLKYDLAERLCAEFEFEVPKGVMQTLAKLRKEISKRSAVLDLELQSASTLSQQSMLSFAQVNLGRGWTAP